MANKPGKLGIKFRVLADAACPCAQHPAVRTLESILKRIAKACSFGEYAVLKLTEPFVNKGHNVTSDNFFTSLRLKDKLSKRTTLVGTVRGNRHQLPPEFTTKRHNVHSVLQGYSATHQAVFVSCHPKKGKLVNLLSTMHSPEADVSQDGTCKPEVITLYNSAKEALTHLIRCAGSIQQKLHVDDSQCRYSAASLTSVASMLINFSSCRQVQRTMRWSEFLLSLMIIDLLTSYVNDHISRIKLLHTFRADIEHS